MSKKDSKRPVKRKSISLDTKIEILNRFQKGEGPNSIAKCYGINESTVRTIKKMEKTIRRSVFSGSIISSKYSSYTRNTAMETMEKALMIWIQDNAQKGIRISSNVIRHKAVNIYNHLKDLSTSSAQQRPKFSGSKGWYENFKKRHSLRNLQVKGEAISADKVTAKQFPLPVGHKLQKDESINMVPETHLEKESNSDSSESVLFTAQNIDKALRLAAELENVILNIDPNIKRALKFQQDLQNCCSQYHEIYKNLMMHKLEKRSSEKIKTKYNNEPDIKVQIILTDDDSNLKLIRNKKLAVLELNSDSDRE